MPPHDPYTLGTPAQLIASIEVESCPYRHQVRHGFTSVTLILHSHIQYFKFLLKHGVAYSMVSHEMLMCSVRCPAFLNTSLTSRVNLRNAQPTLQSSVLAAPGRVKRGKKDRLRPGRAQSSFQGGIHGASFFPPNTPLLYTTGAATRAVEATIRTFRIVQNEGSREVTRNIDFYHLDAIILISCLFNSVRATPLRQWATQVLKKFAIKGYVLEAIREIRLSARRFYQKITDIYATSLDYNKDAPTTKTFFAKVQNKLHFAIHGQTAAE